MANPKLGKNTGNAGKGRPKGSKNRTTLIAKEAIATAAEKIGGAERLTAWVLEDPQNEKVFWSQIYTKLLPHQIEGAGEDGEIIFRTIYEAR